MIAVVVPTIRPESFKNFMEAWNPLFEKHNVEVISVWDGEKPELEYRGKRYTPDEIMGKYKGCLTNFNAGMRNLGFAYIAKYLPNIEYIITLDDDVRPLGDTIKDHIRALKQSVPVSWMSTASEYMRGFPYGVRDEAEVVMSHGVWVGVPDFDAPTQLVMGSHRKVGFYQGPIPKGTLFPVCSMNLAFKRKLLPWIFQAPKVPAMNIARVDDIWAGIVAKRAIDKEGWAAVSGLAAVHHERESNVFKNLQAEAVAMELNETYWQGDETHPYFELYRNKLKLWQTFLDKEGV